MKRYLLTLLVMVSLGLVAAPALYAHGTHGVDVDLVIQPDAAAPGDTVTASGMVMNTGTQAEPVWLKLTVTVNDRTYPLAYCMRRLRAGQQITVNVPFRVPARAPEGTYLFTLRGWIPLAPVVWDEASAGLTILPPP